MSRKEAGEMGSVRSIVFVCLHGAAKSVIASAYLNRLSAKRGLDIRSVATGIEPEAEVSPHVCAGLLQEGLDVRHYCPRRATPEELAAAWRVVSFGCDLDDVVPPGAAIERWDDVPLVSDGFRAARDAIATRVHRLLDGYDRADAADTCVESPSDALLDHDPVT